MEDNLVSIIMPSWNTARFIEESIQSVIAQTYTNWELLIVDDASTDNSLAEARKFEKTDARIKVFASEKNRGVSASRNFAIKHASGRYVAFLDSDDWFGRNKLEVVFQIICKEHSDLLYHKMFRASSK